MLETHPRPGTAQPYCGRFRAPSALSYFWSLSPLSMLPSLTCFGLSASALFLDFPHTWYVSPCLHAVSQAPSHTHPLFSSRRSDLHPAHRRSLSLMVRHTSPGIPRRQETVLVHIQVFLRPQPGFQHSPEKSAFAEAQIPSHLPRLDLGGSLGSFSYPLATVSLFMCGLSQDCAGD